MAAIGIHASTVEQFDEAARLVRPENVRKAFGDHVLPRL
jgi:hypothetical protein